MGDAGRVLWVGLAGVVVMLGVVAWARPVERGGREAVGVGRPVVLNEAGRAVGGFETLESVGEVSGVGPRTLERWRGHVVVERQ